MARLLDLIDPPTKLGRWFKHVRRRIQLRLLVEGWIYARRARCAADLSRLRWLIVEDRYSVCPWPSSPSRADACGRALVLPGGGYTVDHPVLFWACQVLAQVGWHVVTMRWRTDGVAAADTRRFVEAGAERLDADAGPAAETLVLARSLGSYAAAWASARGYPAVWLTPVLTNDFIAEALRDCSTDALLVGGTGDDLWDSQRAAATTSRVLELPGADHALHNVGDWRGSLVALERTLAAVEQFATATRDAATGT